MKTFFLPLSLLHILGLLACEGDPVAGAGADRAAKAAKVAEETIEKAADAVEDLFEGNSEGYAYNPIAKRDPFRSFISGQRDDEIRSPTPLQRYDVDQYHLVGIVWGVAKPRAMVQDPSRTGHVLELGTYIGKNWGKVTQITARDVVVTEEFQTIEGELVTNQLVLKLPVNEVLLNE